MAVTKRYIGNPVNDWVRFGDVSPSAEPMVMPSGTDDYEYRLHTGNVFAVDDAVVDDALVDQAVMEDTFDTSHSVSSAEMLYKKNGIAIKGPCFYSPPGSGPRITIEGVGSGSGNWLGHTFTLFGVYGHDSSFDWITASEVHPLRLDDSSGGFRLIMGHSASQTNVHMYASNGSWRTNGSSGTGLTGQGLVTYAVTCDGTNTRCYRNGTQTLSSTSSAWRPTNVFQMYTLWAHHSFECEFSDMIIWNRALSGSELSDIDTAVRAYHDGSV